MELIARLLEPSVNPITNKGTIAFEVENIRDALTEYPDLTEKKLRVEVKPYREKRSRSANAYFWELCGQMALRLKTTAQEIHDRYVFEFRNLYRDDNGELEWIALPEKLDGSIANRESRDNRKYYIVIGEGTATLKGKQCKMRYWARIKGTRDCDKAEMAAILDDLVSEAQSLGIQTETPDEIARLLSLMEENDGKKA